MSPMTILATLALASPTNESGPVWSAMTPTLTGSEPAVGDSATVSSLECRLRGNEPRAVRGLCFAVWLDTSGGLPISDTPLRLSEFVATLALAQGNAFGQPLESQLRSCLLATSIS